MCILSFYLFKKTLFLWKSVQLVKSVVWLVCSDSNQDRIWHYETRSYYGNSSVNFV